MCENFDYSVKLSSVFIELEGIELTIDDFDLPIRTYNSLYKGGVTELQQILAMSGDGLLSAIAGGESRKQETFWYLINRLEGFNTNSVFE